MGRVFVCGDIHGSADISKLWGLNWPQGRTLSRDDFLIILGDFGLIWSDPASEDTRFWLDWLECRPWTTLFIDGNHENHDLIDAFAVTRWHGGLIHRIPDHPHLIHLMRGQVFDMEDHGLWFTMGGARSQDRQWRMEGRTWWSREMPSEEEYREAQDALQAHDWAVDYVFTHDCPSALLCHAMPWFDSHPEYEPERDRLTDFLQHVDERLDHDRLRRWYSGHYHLDTILGDDLKHVVLYQQVVELGALPLEHHLADDPIDGLGFPLAPYSLPILEVMRRERATEDEMETFVRDRLKLDHTLKTMDPERQRIFHRWLEARRGKALKRRGPASDIL